MDADEYLRMPHADAERLIRGVLYWLGMPS